MVESPFQTASEFWADDDPALQACDSSLRNQKVSLGFKINDALTSIFGTQKWATLYGDTYFFNGSYYQLKTQEEVTAIVEKWWSKVYPDTFFIKHGNEVYNRLKQKNVITIEKLNIPTELVPFQNGYYDLKHRCFLPGCNSAYHFTEGFNFCFHEIPKTTDWQEKPILFLFHVAQMFPNDPVIQEEILTAICYSLTNNITYQIGFVLLGRSNCGKSTLMEILQNMVGLDHFVDYNPLGFVKREREVMYGIILDSLIVNCDEIESSAYWASEVIGGLKHLITTSYITGRRLFGHPVKKKNKNHLWVTANYLPRLYSYDDGICRRWKCWYSDQSYIHNKDLTRKQDVLEYEREKLICYLFTNYSDFTGLLDLDETYNKTFWQKYASNVYSFLRDMCELRDDVSIPTSLLYDAYCEYCESAVSKEKPLSVKYFGQYLHQNGVRTITVGQEKTYIYQGICLKVKEFGKETSEAPPSDEDISKLLFDGFTDLTEN